MGVVGAAAATPTSLGTIETATPSAIAIAAPVGVGLGLRRSHFKSLLPRRLIVLQAELQSLYPIPAGLDAGIDQFPDQRKIGHRHFDRIAGGVAYDDRLAAVAGRVIVRVQRVAERANIGVLSKKPAQGRQQRGHLRRVLARCAIRRYRLRHDGELNLGLIRSRRDSAFTNRSDKTGSRLRLRRHVEKQE